MLRHQCSMNEKMSQSDSSEEDGFLALCVGGQHTTTKTSEKLFLVVGNALTHVLICVPLNAHYVG